MTIANDYWEARGSDSLRKRARSAGDERTPTFHDLARIALADEIAQELSACLDEPTISHLSDETVRPSEAGWLSFEAHPWVSARDMAHKHSQDMALEMRPWVTEAGTGWYGEMSPAGFGTYDPSVGMASVNAQDSAGELADLLPTDEFSQAHTVGALLDANGEMLPMTDEMLAEARLAVGLRANGAWHSAPLENDRWLTDGGLYTGPPSSMTQAEAIDEFGSYETAGEVSHRFDSFNQAAEALENAPATYRAEGTQAVVPTSHEALELAANGWLDAHSSCCGA